MTAVVLCRSSVGGSPIIATLRTPPAWGCSSAADAGLTIAPTSARETARTPPPRRMRDSFLTSLLEDLPHGGDDVVRLRGRERFQRRAERDGHVGTGHPRDRRVE